MNSRGIQARSQDLPAKRLPFCQFGAVRKTRHRRNCKAFPASNPQAAAQERRYRFRSQGLSRESWVGQENSQSEEEIRWPTRKATLPTRFFTCRRAG